MAQRVGAIVVESDRDGQRVILRQFKQLALIKYVQYLASRQDVLKGIYANKSGPRAAEPESDRNAEPSFRETLIFDLPPDNEEPEVPDRRLKRLPRGESVFLPGPQDRPVPIVLSRHNFDIVKDDPATLVDEAGSSVKLKPGRNVVGRHPDSDAMIVRGLIALLLRVYSGRRPYEILATPPDFFDAIELGSHLSGSRANGLAAMVDHIQAYARSYGDAETAAEIETA